MDKDLQNLRAGMVTKKTSEPVAGLLAFAFGLVLVGVVVGLVWAVFDTPQHSTAPIIADADVLAPPPLRQSTALTVAAETNNELAGGAPADVVLADVPNLPSGKVRDAHLRQYIDTIDQLEDCARDVGALNLRDLKNVYIRGNRPAYEAWMNARVADLPLIRRTTTGVDSADDPAMALQHRGAGLPAPYPTGALSVNECAQLKIDVQSGDRDITPPPPSA